VLRLSAAGENRSNFGDFALTRSVWPKISGRRGRLTIHFRTDSWSNECLTTLSLTFFTLKKNFVADILQAKCDFIRKSSVLRFWAPLWDLGATYDDHLRLVGKRVVDFLVVLFELLLLDVTAEKLPAYIGDFAPTGAGWPKILGRRGRPHQPVLFSEQ